MDNELGKVILIIADISGYTSYMVAHRESLAHGQVLITKLLEAIISQAEIPIDISKLEGDAVFMYAAAGPENDIAAVAEAVSSKLVKFFDAFFEKLRELTDSNMCNCPACCNLEKLNLKLVIHAGEALFHKIGRFSELSGVDVITVHRLLKNKVESDRYILMTEKAYELLDFEGKSRMAQMSEEFSDLGVIKTRVYYMGGSESSRTVEKPRINYSSAYYKLKNLVSLIANTLLIRSGLKRAFDIKTIEK